MECVPVCVSATSEGVTDNNSQALGDIVNGQGSRTYQQLDESTQRAVSYRQLPRQTAGEYIDLGF